MHHMRAHQWVRKIFDVRVILEWFISARLICSPRRRRRRIACAVPN
jgi:hypothetical protein